MLDEVHFPTQRSFSYDQVTGLEDFETQLGQDDRHKMRVGVGKQGHVGYQATAVVADDLLHGRDSGETFRRCQSDTKKSLSLPASCVRISYFISLSTEYLWILHSKKKFEGVTLMVIFPIFSSIFIH